MFDVILHSWADLNLALIASETEDFSAAPLNEGNFFLSSQKIMSFWSKLLHSN